MKQAHTRTRTHNGTKKISTQTLLDVVSTCLQAITVTVGEQCMPVWVLNDKFGVFQISLAGGKKNERSPAQRASCRVFTIAYQHK